MHGLYDVADDVELNEPTNKHTINQSINHSITSGGDDIEIVPAGTSKHDDPDTTVPGGQSMVDDGRPVG